MGQRDKIQSRELLGLFICVCIALCTTVADNTAQNKPDNFPTYAPDDNNNNYKCGPMPNVMAALPNIGGTLCSTPQSLANAHY